jgi:pyroglutamyl-peptidase
VREVVPALWERDTGGGKKIDFMVHVGMAGGRDFYSVERRGHRDGYAMGDVDGVVLGDERGTEGWVWEGCPVELESGVDVDDVWRRWRRALPVGFVSVISCITYQCQLQ